MGTWLDPIGPYSRAVYWRRRVVSAAVLLLGLFLVARACGSDRPPDLIRAGQTQTPVPLVSTYTPTPTPTPTPMLAGRGDTDTARPTAKAKPVGCAERDIEVTVRADARRYPPTAKPRLVISVANRSATACTFDVGSKALTLAVTSGKDRIWSSADCQRRGTSEVRLLKPGKGFAASVVWAKVRSSVGCPQGLPTVKPGTYLLSGSANGIRQQRPAVFLLD